MEDLHDLGDKYLRELVEEKHLVAVDTDHCTEWKSSHTNCVGCISHLGCSKFVGLKLLPLLHMGYAPSSFEDYQSMMRKTTDTMKKLLEAETVEETKRLI